MWALAQVLDLHAQIVAAFLAEPVQRRIAVDLLIEGIRLIPHIEHGRQGSESSDEGLSHDELIEDWKLSPTVFAVSSSLNEVVHFLAVPLSEGSDRIFSLRFH